MNAKLGTTMSITCWWWVFQLFIQWIYACYLIGLLISLLFWDVTLGFILLYVAGWLYFFLFLAIPIFSLNLFTAEPEVSDSRLFELLPWKPLNFVTSIYWLIFQGETPSIPRPFWVRHVCRLVLTSIVLIVINWITWFDQLRNTDLFGNITIIGVLFNREVSMSGVITSSSNDGWMRKVIRLPVSEISPIFSWQ